MTPLLNPANANQGEERYNRAHISTRNYIERQIGVWKMRFLALLYGLRSRNVETNLTVIVATAVLHNICRDMNEDMPPVPDHINHEQLQYLLNLDNIPVVPEAEYPNNNIINHRHNLIQYFGNM